MRLYPHPPVLLRRALVPDTLPGGYEVGHCVAVLCCLVRCGVEVDCRCLAC